MLRRFATWLLRRQARRTAEDADRFGDSLRRRTVRVFTRPIRTIASTAAVLAVVGVLYLVGQRPTALQGLLDAETVTAGQLLALLPPVYVLVPAVVLVAVVWNVGRVWGGVRRDMGWNRYDRHR